MVYVQWQIHHELDKGVIDWEQVCLLFHANNDLCKVRDEYGMFPLHYACYHNAPLWAIQFFLRLWCMAMKEVVPIIETSTGISSDWTALELACDADALDEVINYLVQLTQYIGLPLTDWGGSILMERNQNIHLVKGYFHEWDCQYKEYLYCPLKQNLWIKQAYYRLHNNDPDLVHLTIGWPLPMESTLEAVVEVIKCNKTVVTLVISNGH